MKNTYQDSVEEQLERILSSAEFVTREKLSRFLQYVVGHSKKNGSRKIKQYTIAVEGLGYDEKFDPSVNPTIRIMAQRLRRALDQYYAGAGASDPIRISIPKGSYVPAICRNTGGIQNAESAPGDTIPDTISTQSQDPLPDCPSIVVLPLEYLGTNPDHKYIASGISEEIVIALTRFPEFLVIGPLDRDKVKQAHMGPRKIGREYRVRFVLDGSVRLRGDSLRISAKLTDTLTGQQLWAQVFDYDLASASVALLEDDIVGQVVAQIADNFGVIPRTLAKETLPQKSGSLSDYRAVLLFHHHVRTVTEKSLTEAVMALEQVVQNDPNNDLALALLADLVASPYWLGYTDDRAGLDRAAQLAQRALALSPNSQAAHISAAIVCYLTFDKARCMAEINEALHLNPNNANYIANSALFLVGLGESDSALNLINKAMRLNPHHPRWYHIVPFLYHYYQGDYTAAQANAEAFNTPDYFWDPLLRTAVYGRLGHQADAENARTELLTLVPDFEQRGRDLVKRMLFLDEHVDMIWKGFEKAGIES
jgi:adenylate cyclase